MIRLIYRDICAIINLAGLCLDEVCDLLFRYILFYSAFFSLRFRGFFIFLPVADGFRIYAFSQAHCPNIQSAKQGRLLCKFWIY